MTPPAPRPVELYRFLESPGRDEASVRLWLRFNREVHRLEQGARDFLDTLGRFSAQLPAEVVFTHEHVQLDAELLLQELVVNGMRFLKLQQRARLDLRMQRDIFLLELARQLGCTVEQLPWSSASPQG